jgi:hypothetical protein
MPRGFRLHHTCPRWHQHPDKLRRLEIVMLRAAKRSRSIHAKQPPKREWILRLRAG